MYTLKNDSAKTITQHILEDKQLRKTKQRNVILALHGSNRHIGENMLEEKDANFGVVSTRRIVMQSYIPRAVCHHCMCF